MNYKILGSGGYGIILSPPLKIHKSKQKKYVSKIIQKKKIITMNLKYLKN